jgi:hypothetical protein
MWTDHEGAPIPENIGFTGPYRFPGGAAVRLPLKTEPEAEAEA